MGVCEGFSGSIVWEVRVGVGGFINEILCFVSIEFAIDKEHYSIGSIQSMYVCSATG